ncbi:hypothetical protein LR48_Vigan10g099500 [Vigna angularis]|uniref:Uncharacterized protein n=1 Tax=Phaseolus angularis TaxID=3914 RepID=A0A0L9VJE5_PHAAN|nr:hypothetical protein LR48_Vigan10g099500 [Vigna angularis]
MNNSTTKPVIQGDVLKTVWTDEVGLGISSSTLSKAALPVNIFIAISITSTNHSSSGKTLSFKGY